LELLDFELLDFELFELLLECRPLRVEAGTIARIRLRRVRRERIQNLRVLEAPGDRAGCCSIEAELGSLCDGFSD
jgi:hypothetical protein